MTHEQLKKIHALMRQVGDEYFRNIEEDLEEEEDPEEEEDTEEELEYRNFFDDMDIPEFAFDVEEDWGEDDVSHNMADRVHRVGGASQDQESGDIERPEEPPGSVHSTPNEHKSSDRTSHVEL